MKKGFALLTLISLLFTGAFSAYAGNIDTLNKVNQKTDSLKLVEKLKLDKRIGERIGEEEKEESFQQII